MLTYRVVVEVDLKQPLVSPMASIATDSRLDITVQFAELYTLFP